jgi:hypothetical protein
VAKPVPAMRRDSYKRRGSLLDSEWGCGGDTQEGEWGGGGGLLPSHCLSLCEAGAPTPTPRHRRPDTDARGDVGRESLLFGVASFVRAFREVTRAVSRRFDFRSPRHEGTFAIRSAAEEGSRFPANFNPLGSWTCGRRSTRVSSPLLSSPLRLASPCFAFLLDNDDDDDGDDGHDGARSH